MAVPGLPCAKRKILPRILISGIDLPFFDMLFLFSGLEYTGVRAMPGNSCSAVTPGLTGIKEGPVTIRGLFMVP
jgi:hypothetical protein